MAFLQTLVSDVLRSILQEWCGVVEFAQLQIVLTISPAFWKAFGKCPWFQLSRRARQCILTRLNHSERYMDLLMVLRQIPMREPVWISSYRWLQHWMRIFQSQRWWLVLDHLHIAVNTITDTTLIEDPRPDWLISRAIALEYRDEKVVNPPSNIWDVTLYKVPRITQPWSWVHTLTIGNLSSIYSYQYVVDFACFPVLRELYVSMWEFPGILNWQAANSLESIYTHVSCGVFDPPSIRLPRLRHLDVGGFPGPTQRKWVTFAMTLQAHIIESLTMSIPIPRLKPCPCLTYLRIKRDLYSIRDQPLPVIPDTHFPALREISVHMNSLQDPPEEWLQSLPKTVTMIVFNNVIYP